MLVNVDSEIRFKDFAAMATRLGYTKKDLALLASGGTVEKNRTYQEQKNRTRNLLNGYLPLSMARWSFPINHFLPYTTAGMTPIKNWLRRSVAVAVDGGYWVEVNTRLTIAG
jgi:hypothetical protein